MSSNQQPPVMTFAEFATSRGLTTDYDVQGHIHAGLRSAPQTKTYRRWNARKLEELQNARDEAKRLYQAAVDAHEITTPVLSSTERLLMIANGHPDNESTQAARRLLAEKGIAFPPDTETSP